VSAGVIKFSTCLLHFASSLNVIPKCLWFDVSGINFRPPLFLVYINDIGDKLLSLSRLFADDTYLAMQAKMYQTFVPIFIESL
jgi:hypothetical protein